MKTISLFVCVLGLFILSAQSVKAQEIWQVDGRVSLDLDRSGGYRILHANVKVDNDDTARSPKLIVTLPRNSEVTGIKFAKGFENTPYQIMGSNNLAVSHESGTKDSYVQFDIRNLNKEAFGVSITFVPTEKKYRPKSQAAAFIYGITPDLNKKNNYAVIAVE